jgi:hypothetical protein
LEQQEKQTSRLCSANYPHSVRQPPSAGTPVAASIVEVHIVAEKALVAVPARAETEPLENPLSLVDLPGQHPHLQIAMHNSKLPGHNFDKNELRVLPVHYSVYSS